MLKTGKAPRTDLDTDHIPLDADVFLLDNSGSKKAPVSRTDKGDGNEAPIAVALIAHLIFPIR